MWRVPRVHRTKGGWRMSGIPFPENFPRLNPKQLAAIQRESLTQPEPDVPGLTPAELVQIRLSLEGQMHRLDQREAALTLRSAQLDSREAGLAQALLLLDRERESLERTAALYREQVDAKRVDDDTARAAALDARERRLNAWQGDLHGREAELHRQRDENELCRDLLEQRAANLAAQTRLLREAMEAEIEATPLKRSARFFEGLGDLILHPRTRNDHLLRAVILSLCGCEAVLRTAEWFGVGAGLGLGSVLIGRALGNALVARLRRSEG